MNGHGYGGFHGSAHSHSQRYFFAHRHLSTSGRDEIAARRSEYPWLVAMVGYTMLSLWLLAQPLVKEADTTSALPAPAVVASASVTTSR